MILYVLGSLITFIWLICLEFGILNFKLCFHIILYSILILSFFLVNSLTIHLILIHFNLMSYFLYLSLNSVIQCVIISTLIILFQTVIDLLFESNKQFKSDFYFSYFKITFFQNLLSF